MPFLDAKALRTDPEGLAFLRSVIAPPSQCPWPEPKAGRLQELCLLQQRRHCCSHARGDRDRRLDRGRLTPLGLRVTASQVGAIWCPDSQTARRML